MANNEDEAKIIFSAEADKSSAEQTGKELRKSVEKGFGNDGRINAQVDITVPIDSTKKKLTEAQKDITSELSKMMAKGFSASGKDIDTLISKFNTFVKAFDSAGKGRRNKTFKEIRRQVEELRKSYDALRTETKVEKTYTPKVSTNKSANKIPKTTSATKKQSKKVDKKIYEGLKEAGPADYKKTSWLDPSRTNDHESHASEYSPHATKGARQSALSEKESRPGVRKSLKTEKYGNKEDFEAALDRKHQADKKTTHSNRRIVVVNEDGKRVPKVISDDWETPNRTTPTRKPTSIESAREMSNAIKEDILPKLVDEVKTTTNDEEITALREKLLATLETISKLNQTAGKTIFKDVTSSLDSVLKQLGFKVKGRIGGINGDKDVTDISREDRIEKLLKDILNDIAKKQEDIRKELIQIEESNTSPKKSQSNKGTEKSNSLANKLIAETQAGISAQKQSAQELAKTTEGVNRSVKIGNTKDAVDSSNEQKINKTNSDINRDTAKAVKSDATTGFNTTAKTEELIELVRNILQQVQIITGNKKTATSTSEIQQTQSKIKDAVAPVEKSLIPLLNSTKISVERPNAVSKAEWNNINSKTIENTKEPFEMQKSHIYASPFKKGIWKSLELALVSLTGASKEYEKVLRANADDQDKMAAERIKKYGLSNGRNPNDTGDIARMRRMLQLYRRNQASIDQNPELAQDITLTPGVEVDTTELTKVFNKALSGKRMQNAYNGGGFFKNLFGFATGGLGYAFMPSLEKSRALADGLNQMLGTFNKALQTVSDTIATKETQLSGMIESGEAEFDSEGHLVKGSSAAYKTLADLEEEKVVLDSIRADLLANSKIVKLTGGDYALMVKHMKFASPALQECNGILRNLNSGFDKNGKALKFQNRLAEIMNYTFQLMTRSIGQMFKNWLSMVNPINLIKKAFSDFTSYNVKWQRTMNVIKYNLRTIIRPIMDDIAQKLVNMIGFADIISQKIQAAFGKIPISLFDQAAADTEKMTEELEAASNVSAGFDELHDIGSDNSGANDLLGDIYKPQLSPEWQKLAEDIGDLFAHVIKGDMGFSEVMTTIVKLLGQALSTIAKTIWEWFKNTAIGKYITEHWADILATILAAFVGWKLLKIAGKLLFNALFGNFTESGIASVFSKVGGWITGLLGKNAFGKGILEGVTSLFSGSGGLLSTMKSIFVGHDAITAFGAWGETLGALFAQSLLAVAGVALAGFSLSKGSDKMRKNTAYNVGLESTGGNDKDKKSNVGAGILSTLGSTAGFAALGTAIAPGIGTAIGAAVGVIAGVINTALAPALEKAAIKAKDMNNEMQKLEYYEGQVQGAQSSVDIFTEQLDLLKQSLDLATQSVYDQGEKLGISKSRMDELVKATQNGTFNTGMLTGAETELAESLTNLAEKQQHTTEVSEKLEAAQKKLLKAQTDLSIAQDVEAGNFEVAAARIEVAEMQGVYTTEDATAKRIQLYKQGSEEERKNLLQNLTPEQRKKMLEYNATTDKELKELNKLWNKSSDEIKKIFTNSIDQDTINKFNRSLNSIDSVMAEHQGVWQRIGDTIAEIFTFGNATTYTYNKEDAGYKDIAKRLNSGKITTDQVDEATLSELRKRKLISFDVGTNYVPSDGLAYLHQGEAVIPKKYNQPYQPGTMSPEEKLYMSQMMNTMKSLDSTMKRGITVNGEFTQRGSDLVAVVNKTKSQTGADLLSNVAYAR